MKQVLLVFMLGLFACKPEFEPIDYGHDACAHCKMTIIDKRFAAEIVTEKGKAYKFDDLACLLKYTEEENFNSIGMILFVSDYSKPDNNFLDAHQAVYLHSGIFKSPMNGNLAAFASAKEAAPFKDSLQSDLLKLEDLGTNE
ncbi:MAG TPA: nitrous oxide reductase accessory protein NosL [Chitinophaga sp.]|uniref:nitrous oxide reductase accessory protein NosL n=1 Tax=Chitinophaga sp. TaxID=1869181 RepID=UPI002F951C83